MSKKEITAFDHSEMFEGQIQPLLDEVKNICAKTGIPFYYEFAVSNSAEETQYKREILAPRGKGLVLCVNTILDHNLVARGFKPVPPSEVSEFDVADMSSLLEF